MIKFDSILTAMGNFLIKNETPQKSDVIIVLAGDSGTRIVHGCKLYQAGYAEKILLSGDNSGYMTKKALSLGITESSILPERQSNTTFGNAKHSLKIVQDQRYKSAIVVTTAYHTHRASMIFSQFFKGIDLTFCAVSNDPIMTHNWWKDNYSTRVVISEYFKLVWHYLVDSWAIFFFVPHNYHVLKQ